MLQIPFISQYIEKIVKKQVVADNVDTLNYYVTSLLLAFFSLAISAKQYFGTPIQCWVPMEFRGGWEKYAEDYCFIANSYYVPMDEEHIQDHHRGDRLTYYRWVPIMLAIQATLFFLPNYIWNILHKNTAINPEQYIEEAIKIKGMSGEGRDKEMESLADQFMEGVSSFGSARYGKSRPVMSRSGWNATYLYLLTKALYVMNVLGQMILLNAFLGGSYFSWGADTISDIVAGREWTEAEVFPRVIMCDFSVRALANLRSYSVQCVIMMNMINEKLYLFIYVWFLFLIAATIANFLYYLVTLSIPWMRVRLALSDGDERRFLSSRMHRNRFVHDCLHPDGVLLINFIREHAGGRVASELVTVLMRKYANEALSNGTSSLTSHSSSGGHSPNDCEKKPMLNSMEIGRFDRYDPPPKMHGQAPPKFVSTPNRTMETAPPMEDIFDSYPTLRVEDRNGLPRPSPRNNKTNGTSLDQPDTGRNSTPTDV